MRQLSKQAEKLKDFLAGAGMSQAQLAAALDCTPGRVSQILSGSPPSARLAAAIDKISLGTVPFAGWF